MDLSSIDFNFVIILDCGRLAPLELILSIVCSVVVLSSIPFLWTREQTWRIIAGTLDATAVLDPFSVSINSVNNRFVVVAVPATNGNELS